MTGNPYKYFSPSKQIDYFNFDGTIEEIEKIYFFAELFPNQDDDKSHAYDIFLKDIYFQACESLTNEQLMSTFLKLITPSGTIFYPNNMTELNQKPIEHNVDAPGQEISPEKRKKRHNNHRR